MDLTLAPTQRRSLERFARMGLMAKGSVYLLAGALTALQALLPGYGPGELADQGDTLRVLSRVPFGRVAVGFLGFSLLGYVTWRLFQAFADPAGYGRGPKGLVKRVGCLLSGLTHLALSMAAFSFALGHYRSDPGDRDKQAWAAHVLHHHLLGSGMLLLLALIIGAVGVAQFLRAFQKGYRKQLRPEKLSSAHERAFDIVAQVGFTARGITLLLGAFFLFRAAWHAQASEVRGLDGIFRFLESRPWGPYWLAFVALGTMCYGAFLFVLVKYGRMERAG